MADLSFTHIFEAVRKELNLSRDEYALCSYIQVWSSYPGTKSPGRCNRTQKQMAEWVGISDRGIRKMINRLISDGLISKNASGETQISVRWFELVTEAKEELCSASTRNKVPHQEEQSSASTRNKVPTHIEYIKEDKKEREENEKLAPSKTEFSSLNTPLKKETPQSPPLAAETEFISMGARTKAETPTELIDQLRDFYISRMNEWNVGVMQKAKAIRYTPEQREEILLSFCCYQIKTNSGADTYGMHHAALMQWFSREKQFNQTKPAMNQAAELSAIAKLQIKKRTSAPRPEWMGPEQMPGL